MYSNTRIAAGIMIVAAVSIGSAGCSSSGSSEPAASSSASSSASATATGGTSGTAALPTGWPTDVPAPTGLALTRVIPSPTAPTGKIAIYTGSGDKAAIDAQMTSGLANAGYTKVSSSAPAASVSISSWKKGGTTVGLNINSAGGNVTCSVSVNPVG